LRHENYLFPGHPIIQDDRYFKLSQDSVVLGAFLKVKKGEHFLDLGCGIGVLTMIALIRNPGCTGVGLEITEGAAELAAENLVNCGLSGRGEIICRDMRELQSDLSDRFEVVISNPPYFAPTRGFSSPSEAIARARNESTGDIGDVCRAASKALKWGGRFYVCYPPDRMADLFEALRQNRLEPKVMRLVFPTDQKAPCLLLIEARKGGGMGLNILPSLILRRDGQKTPEFEEIYRLNTEDK